MNIIASQENIYFLYICENPQYFKIVEGSFFTNKYIKKLFDISKLFFNRFNEIPFDFNDPSIKQIRAIAEKNVKKIITDDGLTDAENLQNFINNAENIIIETEYNNYDSEWIKSESDAWIELKSFEYGLQEAVKYSNSQQKTSENIRDIIAKCRDIIISRSNISIEDGVSEDFHDPEAHKQVLPTDLLSSGFPLLNTWLSDNRNGGFERKTVTMLIGEPNVGKSIWLASLASGIYLSGDNVLIISVEMSVQKIYKRIGSNIFDIDIRSYGDYSQDTDRMSNVIREYKDNLTQNNFNPKPIGSLRAYKMAKASPIDIELFAKKEEQRLGIKFGAIVIDYLTELDNAHGINSDRSYSYHKSNMNDLYKAANSNDWAIITAHQLKGESFGADDLTLQDLGESKGLSHRPDNIWGIIQPPDLKLENLYILKNLKGRDNGYKNFKIKYRIDYNHMRLLEDDVMIEPSDMISMR